MESKPTEFDALSEIIFRGIGVSSGVIQGKAHLKSSHDDQVVERPTRRSNSVINNEQIRKEKAMKYTAFFLAAAALLAFVSAGYGNDETILKEAIVRNDLAAVSNYIAGDIDLNQAADNDGLTPLHIAASGNRLEIASLLIAQQTNINARDNLGMTPLHWAAYKGHRAMTAILLENRAEINATDINGLTPLHLAATYGHKDIINLLLDSGADLNARTYDQSMTPIHWAAFCGHTESLKPLLKHGADINSRDSEGDTPLTWAEEFLHYDMARLIARKGGKRRIN